MTLSEHGTAPEGDLAALLEQWLESGQPASDALTIQLDGWVSAWAKHRTHIWPHAMDAARDRLYGVKTGITLLERMKRYRDESGPVSRPLGWLAHDLLNAVRTAARRHWRVRVDEAVVFNGASVSFNELPAAIVDAPLPANHVPHEVHRTLELVAKVMRLAGLVDAPSLGPLPTHVDELRGYLRRDLDLAAARKRWVAGTDRQIPVTTRDAWQRAWQARYYKWLLETSEPGEDAAGYTSTTEVPSADDARTHNLFSAHAKRFRDTYARAFAATEDAALSHSYVAWDPVEHATLRGRT